MYVLLNGDKPVERLCSCLHWLRNLCRRSTIHGACGVLGRLNRPIWTPAGRSARRLWNRVSDVPTIVFRSQS